MSDPNEMKEVPTICRTQRLYLNNKCCSYKFINKLFARARGVIYLFEKLMCFSWVCVWFLLPNH